MNVGNRNIYSENSTCKFQSQSLVAIEMNMLIIIINNSFNAFFNTYFIAPFNVIEEFDTDDTIQLE